MPHQQVSPEPPRRPRIFTVGCLMWGVLYLAIYLSFLRSLRPGSANLAQLLTLVLVAQWLIGTPMIKMRQWSAPNALVEPFDPWSGDIPHDVVESVRQDAASIEELGFRNLGHYRVSESGPSTNAFVTVFENQQEGHTSQLLTVKVKVGPVSKSVTTLVFTTEFADGTKLTTSNSKVVSLFPRVRTREGTMSFPRIRDPRKLYEIHQASVARFGGAVKRLMAAVEDAAEFLRQGIRVETAKLAETGYYYIDEKYDVYRPTWKGAILMTSKLVWPVKQIRGLIRQGRAARLLRELMVDGL